MMIQTITKYIRKARCGLIAAIIPLIAATIQPVHAAGTIPVALAQQFNANGQPLVGCNLYTYVTGTVATPQLAYQDTSLTQALPWPVQCDANGRLPFFYLADGTVHPRLTDASGVVQFDIPSMLVIGPSGGTTGGGGTIDPTTIASSGDIKFRVTGETLTGWVKLNGLTIGNGSSGATSRANADTQSLFIYLWTNCTNAHCPVSTGRGATALADFNANKTITLPDWRGRIPVGLDDMGSTAAGRLVTGTVTSGADTVTTPAATGGASTTTLAKSDLPNETPTANSGQRIQSATTLSSTVNAQPYASGNQVNVYATGATFPADSINGGVTQTNPIVMNPFMLGSWYMKL